MFGQKPPLRRRHAQLISRRCRRGFGFGAVALALGLLAISARAQTSREIVDQTSRNQNLVPTVRDYKPESTFWRRITENMHGSYSVTLMGPRFLGASNETYNIYVPDVAPIQLYHSTSLYFLVNDNMTVGMGVDAVQNIANGVRGNDGVIRGQNFVFYDPTVNFTFPNLVKVPGWSVFTTANFSVPITQESIDIGKVSSVNFWQYWRVFNNPSDWSYGFDVNINPQFYTQPFPTGFSYRKTFYASIGHYVSYRVSPNMTIYNSSTFDFDHREGVHTGVFDFGSGLDDRLKLGISVLPSIQPAFMSIGAYLQVLIWNPQLETTITGLDFSIGF